MSSRPLHTPVPYPVDELLNRLSTSIPERLIAVKRIKGTEIRYVPVQQLQRLLDYYTGGWWEKRSRLDTFHAEDGVHVLCVVTIRIHALAGDRVIMLEREDSGEAVVTEKEYGEAVTRAEAQAFRRCCARFGLGLELWDKH